jgi:hypothetical protein
MTLHLTIIDSLDLFSLFHISLPCISFPSRQITLFVSNEAWILIARVHISFLCFPRDNHKLPPRSLTDLLQSQCRHCENDLNNFQQLAICNFYGRDEREHLTKQKGYFIRADDDNQGGFSGSKTRYPSGYSEKSGTTELQ